MMVQPGKCSRVVFFVWLALFSSQARPGETPNVPLGKFACGQPATLISTVQGNGPGSLLAGKVIDVEAIVVGSFQKPGELGGLFVQEEDGDRDQDAQTSEGLFAHTGYKAQTGDRVRLRGTVTEFQGLTELHPVSRMLLCPSAGKLPTPAIVRLPLNSTDHLEALENMRVSFPQTLVISDLYQFWQFGEMGLSSKRLVQPTQIMAPGKDSAKLERVNSRDRLILDDGRTGRNLPVNTRGQDNATPFSADNPIRTGQEISGLAGVMHYGFGEYRLQPARGFMIRGSGNPRSPGPEPVGGKLKLAVFNVLSFFSSLGESGPVCGPSRNQQCRGAHNASEKNRQLQKLGAALEAIDADIFALLELENNPDKSLQEVVTALNSRLGEKVFDYISTGSIGHDAIKVGLLFKPALVDAKGRFALLDHKVDARFDDALSRPALAQAFQVRDGGALLTVIATHLKSKSCSGAGGADADQKDGQGCFNAARARAAAALADWAESDPVGSGSGNVLIMGDFNSYRMEDPIRIMQDENLQDLLARFEGDKAYTYVYQGQVGTLDYVFSSPQLASHVTGATAWHINADEPRILDYKVEPGKPKPYFAADPYRSSDHDPVIIGLDLGTGQASAVKVTPEKDSHTISYMLLAGALLLLIAGVRMRQKEPADTIRKPNPVH